MPPRSERRNTGTDSSALGFQASSNEQPSAALIQSAHHGRPKAAEGNTRVVPAAGVERLSHAVERECANLGDNVRYVDTFALGEVLDEANAWSHDLVHWNDYGNAIMAEALTEALLTQPHLGALR